MVKMFTEEKPPMEKSGACVRRLFDMMNTRLIGTAVCTSMAHQNTGATFLVMHVQQGTIFQE